MFGIYNEEQLIFNTILRAVAHIFLIIIIIIITLSKMINCESTEIIHFKYIVFHSLSDTTINHNSTGILGSNSPNSWPKSSGSFSSFANCPSDNTKFTNCSINILQYIRWNECNLYYTRKLQTSCWKVHVKKLPYSFEILQKSNVIQDYLTTMTLCHYAYTLYYYDANNRFDVISSYHDLGYSTGKQSTHKAFTCNNIINYFIDILWAQKSQLVHLPIKSIHSEDRIHSVERTNLNKTPPHST
ncbi:hypothetical protein AGLY_011883 [Aphis glycines]|uniref:Uncharacterized protein n=1 Tax=Aphis glycines TaxID=307491 RepID=A0A6G0TCT1_APHGL|nr:hypothetical protein AGLY_011883 [Aphis glycines]